MNYIIDRSKWRRGGDLQLESIWGQTQLLNREGNMCCLGFVCIKDGFKKKDILEVADPSDIDPDFADVCTSITLKVHSDEDGIYFHSSELTREAININDSEYISEEQREQQLKTLFKKYGHTIIFIGETDNHKK